MYLYPSPRELGRGKGHWVLPWPCVSRQLDQTDACETCPRFSKSAIQKRPSGHETTNWLTFDRMQPEIDLISAGSVGLSLNFDGQLMGCRSVVMAL